MPKVKIQDIKLGQRHRKDMGDLDSLARSIEEVGLLHPIVITKDKKLVAGQRRIQVARKLGWSEIDAHIVDLEDLILGERAENIERKDFAPSEAVAIAEAIRPLAEQRAKERMLSGKKDPVQNLHRVKSRQEIASAVGLSHASLKKAEEIVRAAQEKPNIFGEFKEAMDSTGNIDGTYREYARYKKREETKHYAPIVNHNKYQIIYADPPWEYNFSVSESREIENQYPTMKLEAIASLPIQELYEANCVLFLWATSPKLPEALFVIEQWGFTYKTCMVWVKDKIGMGYYARQRHELLLIATYGTPPIPLPENRPDSVIESPRNKHSEKPDKVYEIIDRMYPQSRRIELFSRKAIEGWDSWGNEVI